MQRYCVLIFNYFTIKSDCLIIVGVFVFDDFKVYKHFKIAGASTIQLSYQFPKYAIYDTELFRNDKPGLLLFFFSDDFT